MKATNKSQLRKYRFIIISILIYIIGVVLYSVASIGTSKQSVINGIDEKLKVGAYAVYDLLGEDFFKRAKEKDSISLKEDWKNINKLTSFNNHAELAFIYATIKKDGKIYVIASSATQEELDKKEQLHYFHHYASASDKLKATFNKREITSDEYTDKWGDFRSIFVPIKIDENRTVVLAAEVEISYLNKVLREIQQKLIFEGIVFLLLILPFIVSVYYLIRQENKKLYKLSHTDSLTKLPNRLFFIKYLEREISKSSRHNNKFALFFIDLDGFKEINDSHGHDIGDKILIKISELLKNNIREEDTLSRLGGDEFTIIVSSYNQENEITIVAQKILDIFLKPIQIDTYKFYLTCSIGITSYPQDGSTVNTLLKNADTSMYKAKENGKNRFQFYNTKMAELADKQLEMRKDINHAIANNEFYMLYQPQYNSKNDSIIGLESLVRWNHPKKGMIPPDDFIPFAENNGLIIELGKIILKLVFTQAKEWEKSGLKFNKIAINISPQQLYQDDIIEYIKNLLAELKCDPKMFKLEITEQFIMKDQKASITKLQALNDIGIEISIDDFGTGYSSMAYLKNLPVSQLKIDKSFIRNIHNDYQNLSITKAIVQLCKGLNIDVIAEGVETKEELDILKDIGCTDIQGYYYSKPLFVDEVSKLDIK